MISGSWEDASTIGFTARYGLTSNVIGGKIYVFGGISSGSVVNTLEVFDPATDSWSTPETAGLASPRAFHTASEVGGKIYIIGGITQTSSTYPDSMVDVFDPATSSWSSLVTSGTFIPRLWHCAAAVGNKIYVFGGDTTFQAVPTITKTVQVLDLATKAWSTLTTTGKFIPPFLSTCNVIGSKIYFTGGEDSTGNHSLSTYEIFDPVTNSWTIPATEGSMVARGGQASAYVDSNLIVFGGFGASSDISSTQALYISKNEWYTPSFGDGFIARDALTASTVNNEIFTIGGENNASVALSINEMLTLKSDIVTLNNADSALDIFPNPATSILHILCNVAPIREIVIFDALGRKALDIEEKVHSISTDGQQDYAVDLQSLSPGNYFIEIRTNEENSWQRLSILR